MRDHFRHFAAGAAAAFGSPVAFVLAGAAAVVWVSMDASFDFLDAVSLLTFLALFLIQASQLRSDRATHIKLDEIIKSIGEARNVAISIEERPDAALDTLHEEHRKVKDA